MSCFTTKEDIRETINMIPRQGIIFMAKAMIFSTLPYSPQVKTTHYVQECGSPRWECGVEMLVREVCAVTLAVAVLSLPRTAPVQDTELLGLATLSLTTVSYPS